MWVWGQPKKSARDPWLLLYLAWKTTLNRLLPKAETGIRASFNFWRRRGLEAIVSRLPRVAKSSQELEFDKRKGDQWLEHVPESLPTRLLQIFRLHARGSWILKIWYEYWVKVSISMYIFRREFLERPWQADDRIFSEGLPSSEISENKQAAVGHCGSEREWCCDGRGSRE